MRRAALRCAAWCSTDPPAPVEACAPPNLDEASIRTALAGSLRRLQTDYIDLYQVRRSRDPPGDGVHQLSGVTVAAAWTAARLHVCGVQVHWPSRYSLRFGRRQYLPENEVAAVELEETVRCDAAVSEGASLHCCLSGCLQPGMAAATRAPRRFGPWHGRCSRQHACMRRRCRCPTASCMPAGAHHGRAGQGGQDQNLGAQVTDQDQDQSACILATAVPPPPCHSGQHDARMRPCSW